MVTVAAFGRRIHEGFGAMTVDNTKISDLIIGTVFSASVCYLVLGFIGIEAFIVSQLSGLLVLNTANRHFGGVSGDIVGAANEIGRLAALLYIGRYRMDAVVMAGGMGKRLGKDEKPLTLLCGKPLIQYVLEALLGSKNIERIFVATSPRVKRTNDWLVDFKKDHDKVEIIHTTG